MYSSKTGVQWLGLNLGQVMQETGLFWLDASMFNWEQLEFHVLIQRQIRFFIPDSQRTYKERRSQVSNITRLYNGISDIAKSLQKDSSAEDDHKLDQIRRICFLALTIEVLRYDQSNQSSLLPKDLQSYNYGLCRS